MAGTQFCSLCTVKVISKEQDDAEDNWCAPRMAQSQFVIASWKSKLWAGHFLSSKCSKWQHLHLWLGCLTCWGFCRAPWVSLGWAIPLQQVSNQSCCARQGLPAQAQWYLGCALRHTRWCEGLPGPQDGRSSPPPTGTCGKWNMSSWGTELNADSEDTSPNIPWEIMMSVLNWET